MQQIRIVTSQSESLWFCVPCCGSRNTTSINYRTIDINPAALNELPDDGDLTGLDEVELETTCDDEEGLQPKLMTVLLYLLWPGS